MDLELAMDPAMAWTENVHMLANLHQHYENSENVGYEMDQHNDQAGHYLTEEQNIM